MCIWDLCQKTVVSLKFNFRVFFLEIYTSTLRYHIAALDILHHRMEEWEPDTTDIMRRKGLDLAFSQLGTEFEPGSTSLATCSQRQLAFIRHNLTTTNRP